MQAALTTQTREVKNGPTPIASELLKFIGGGVAAPTTSPTPQAPKNKW